MEGTGYQKFAATQIVILPISASSPIENQATTEGKAWSRALDIVERYPGFQRLYWGRHVEEPDQTQLHVVRDAISQHYAFLGSPEWKEFERTISNIKQTNEGTMTIRHAMLLENTLGCKSLGKGAPFTGTAIYVGTKEVAWDAAWTLWSTIVPDVPGNLGVAGGYLVESVEGYQRNFVAYVGWQNIEVHDGYHHTKDFRRKGVILQQGNQGFREYGHVVFSHSRSGTRNKL